MMNSSHTILSVAATSLALGTADPVLLGIAALASQLPDVDTSKSVPGRVLFPLSRLLETHFPHRTLTHSFMATAAIALVTLPIAFWGNRYWLAIVLGYFCGWFGDVFTKSGVAAFYPGTARLVIPGNPRFRLSTGSGAEFFLLMVLVMVAITSININSSGGIMQSFNQVLAAPSGAVDLYAKEGGQHLIILHVKGRQRLSQQPIEQDYEVVQVLNQDFLVRDREGHLLKACGATSGSLDCQIQVDSVKASVGVPIKTRIQQVQVEDQPVADVVDALNLPSGRVYLSGSLQLDDAADLKVNVSKEYFPTIAVSDTGQAALESASPATVVQTLGDYYATGNLLVRTVYVQPQT